MDQAKQFLDALFAGKTDQEHILVWLLDGRRSAWFKDTAAAAAYVNANRSRDVYIGVALSPADHGPHLRLKIEGGERMPSSIVALWSDIDIADAVHKKKNLAPSTEQALTVLFPDFPPSILVHSGGGLQAWWLFKEPWALESEEESAKAGALATRWIRAIRARAAAKGWDIDSVGDLTRVLRIPGTNNCKIPGEPRPATILDINDRRYNPSDLAEFLDLIGADRSPSPTPRITCGEELKYSSEAAPPWERHQAMMDNDPKYRATWDRMRKDMQDQSGSAYDMALANFAVQAGWADQEIANLLIASRRRFKDELKLRDSYYAKTIAKARAAFNNVEVMRKIEEDLSPEPKPTHTADGERIHTQESKVDPMQQKASDIDRLNVAFQLDEPHRIIRIKRYNSEPSEYEAETVSGNIRLGQIEYLVEQKPFYHKMLDITGVQIPPFSAKDWRSIALLLRRACIDVPVGEESNEAGMMRSLLTSYLRERPVREGFKQDNENEYPFQRNGLVNIYPASFRHWLRGAFGERITPKEFGVRMKRIGATPDKVHYGPSSSRQVWVLPETFAPPAKPSDAPAWVTEEQPEESGK